MYPVGMNLRQRGLTGTRPAAIHGIPKRKTRVPDHGHHYAILAPVPAGRTRSAITIITTTTTRMRDGSG